MIQSLPAVSGKPEDVTEIRCGIVPTQFEVIPYVIDEADDDGKVIGTTVGGLLRITGHADTDYTAPPAEVHVSTNPDAYDPATDITPDVWFLFTPEVLQNMVLLFLDAFATAKDVMIKDALSTLIDKAVKAHAEGSADGPQA